MTTIPVSWQVWALSEHAQDLAIDIGMDRVDRYARAVNNHVILSLPPDSRHGVFIMFF
jgi:hypothetical protein